MFKLARSCFYKLTQWALRIVIVLMILTHASFCVRLIVLCRGLFLCR